MVPGFQGTRVPGFRGFRVSGFEGTKVPASFKLRFQGSRVYF